MVTPVSKIYDTCTALLAAVETHHGGTLPARRYVSAGPAAWDCELVAVWCERTYSHDGEVGQELVQSIPGARRTMRGGLFAVEVVRCAPTPKDSGDPPSVAAEEAAAELVYEDGQRTLNALVAAERDGDLPGCHGVAFADWTVQGPEGALVASLLRVRVNLAAI